MTIWSLVDYVTTAGANPFQEWLETLDDAVRGKIDSRLLQMTMMRKWPEKWASSYKGYDRLFEFRIPHAGVQYRPLFTYSKVARMEIILLSGAIEKTKIPKSVLEAADSRRRDIEEHPERVRRHKFDSTRAVEQLSDKRLPRLLC